MKQRAGRAWERTVIGIAHQYGWKVASFRSVLVQGKRGTFYATPVEADGKGWPDLVLVRGTAILFRELKTGKARLTAEQRAWHELLRAAGQDVDVWHPDDLDGVVIPTLSNRSRP